MKFYLLGYFLVYFGLVFFLPSYRVWKQTGINPFVFSNKETAHDYSGKTMKFLIGLIVFTVFTNAFFTDFIIYLVPISYLEHSYLKIIGLVLLHFSVFWTIIAQYQMKQSWRIGIDEVNKTELIEIGIFKFSRNPIFFGILVSILGLFLILPNTLLFGVLLVSFVVLQIQVRLEEEFLFRQHGTQYLDFCKKAKRWI
ncbi:methyltransferase family protein [Leptospira vanthielii]|nr:isoprenylcysteine carboxylmethyltransferase family protein [Leptospira vanthielii]